MRLSLPQDEWPATCEAWCKKQCSEIYASAAGCGVEQTRGRQLESWHHSAALHEDDGDEKLASFREINKQPLQYRTCSRPRC